MNDLLEVKYGRQSILIDNPCEQDLKRVHSFIRDAHPVLKRLAEIWLIRMGAKLTQMDEETPSKTPSKKTTRKTTSKTPTETSKKRGKGQKEATVVTRVRSTVLRTSSKANAIASVQQEATVIPHHVDGNVEFFTTITKDTTGSEVHTHSSRQQASPLAEATEEDYRALNNYLHGVYGNDTTFKTPTKEKDRQRLLDFMRIASGVWKDLGQLWLYKMDANR